MGLFSVTAACIRLFKAVPDLEQHNKYSEADSALAMSALKEGVYIPQEAFIKNEHTASLVKEMTHLYGYDMKTLNEAAMHTFHEASTLPKETLLAQQILHYFSTYGLEALGLESVAYIPAKDLQLPEDTDAVKVTVISCLTEQEIKTRVLKMLSSGIALKQSTQEDIITIVSEFVSVADSFDKIKNKEFKIRLYDLYQVPPTDGEEWLRYVIYKMTGSTLLIKNREMYSLVKVSSMYKNNADVESYFKKADLRKLAEIFLRYRILFLQIKHAYSNCSSYINKIRRLAVKYHKPVKKKVLDLATDINVNLNEFESELKKVTTFKKVSVANAMLLRKSNPTSAAYFIRNGKAFAKEFEGSNEISQDALDMILNSIKEDVRSHVEGKTIYIPDNFNYAMPTSEKLFWNNIPFNSSLKLKDKVILGVHWLDLGRNRVDLDLHLVSNKYSVGWNSYYDDNNFSAARKQDIIFTGDMTSARPPKGATEAYYISENIIADELLQVNLNNFTDNGEVEFKFIIDSPTDDRIDREYLLDSHTTNFYMMNSIPGASMFLGMLDIKNKDKTFYFTSASMSKSIVSRYDDVSRHTLSAMRSKFESCLKVKDVLLLAGARFTKEDNESWDINLDPMQATKDTFISLMS